MAVSAVIEVVKLLGAKANVVSAVSKSAPTSGQTSRRSPHREGDQLSQNMTLAWPQRLSG